MDNHSTFDTSKEILRSIVKNLSSDNLLCLKNCTQVHQLCEQTIILCLKKGGLYSESSHLRTLRDASEICTLAGDFLLRESPMHYVVCTACAETCLVCAQSCERFHDDNSLKVLAEACRYCAEACEKMAMHR